MEKTKIFYDGNCIVCDLEIAHYKRLKPEAFDLVDISTPDFNAQKYGLSPERVEKEMHVFTPQGELKVGVEAFAFVWSQIEQYAWGSRVVQWPIVRPLAGIGYKAFTKIRKCLPKRR